MHRVQQPVTAYDDELARLVADMVETMYAADGVGLAACQIGVDRAMFVFDCPDDDGRRTVGVVCNPELTLPEGKDRQLDEGDEGCLSYPGAFVECARPDFATVTGTGLDGSPVEFTGDGMLARCLQHETDHTLGTVFGDRLLDQAAQEAPARRWRRPPTTSRWTGRPVTGAVAPRVRIVHLSPEALAALAAGDLAARRSSSAPAAADAVAASVRRGDRRPGSAGPSRSSSVPRTSPWVTGVIWCRRRTGAVVGEAGFHGAPDADGMVEVGLPRRPGVPPPRLRPRRAAAP